MNFSDMMAALDAEVFAHLADDRTAIWTLADGTMHIVSAMVDRVERASTLSPGLMQIDQADVVRISAAEVASLAPGRSPESGDTFTLNGATSVVHGEPWRDEKNNGRDWLCPVSA